MFSCIYLISCTSHDNTEYKIGFSKDEKNAKLRLKSHQTGNPYPCKIEYIYKTKHKRKVENTLHRMYSHGRKEGEWFSLEMSDVVNFIQICDKIEKSFDILYKENNHFFKQNK